MRNQSRKNSFKALAKSYKSERQAKQKELRDKVQSEFEYMEKLRSDELLGVSQARKRALKQSDQNEYERTKKSFWYEIKNRYGL